jgi:hypothetical protein
MDVFVKSRLYFENDYFFVQQINDEQSGIDYDQLFVRSNYAHKDVVLLIEAAVTYNITVIY